jgi:phage protein D/phage baseplate assembly protein gpV
MPDTSNLLSQFYVKIDGTDASEEFMHDLIEVTVESSLHLPDVATLTLHDRRLQYIDDPHLAPGKTLEISAKSGQKSDPLFDGEIVELEPDFRPGDPHLVVRAFDRLHRLARGRTVRSFLNVTDEDIVRKIAQEVGLQVEMDATSQVYPYILQSNQTNLDFLRDRASTLGYLLFVRKKTLHCEAPKPVGSPVELEWGKTLKTFQPRMTTVDQVDDVVVRGWDPDARQEIIGQAKNGNGATKVGEKKSGGELAHAAFNLTAEALVTDRPVRAQATADRMAQAVADQIAGQFVEAEGTCGGDPAIIAGSSLQISAVGERFGGTYLVTSAHHTYNAQSGYSTAFSVSGHRAATLFNLLAPEEPPNQVPGLMIGIVTDNQDPENQGRVKVKFPSLSGEHASNWARVSAPGGGPDRGFEFLPEVNDEVLVGFELGDVHYPYVLGGLWNGRDEPPKSSNQAIKGGKVVQRIIRSRTGHIIMLDDDESGGGITIEDKNGNKIFLDAQKNDLTIQVQGNINVKADRNIKIEAGGTLDIQAAATVTVKGASIRLN